MPLILARRDNEWAAMQRQLGHAADLSAVIRPASIFPRAAS